MDGAAGTIETDDKKYPADLKEALKILQASLGPKKLYYKGNIALLGADNCLAVVGSRKLTYYGRKAEEQIVTECASAGIVIVSGFMYGGDEVAHSAAVKCGGLSAQAGKTIAVMPCGIDLVHPPQHKKLYQEILDSGGLIISEYPEKTQPVNYTYVQRDRIVAGLSKAVFVVEAALDSGSLITASYAKKFGRKIFALPGQITSEVARGTNKLIKEGAEIVTEANDILKFYKIASAQEKSGSPASAKSQSVIEMPASLEQKILAYLNREPMKADEIARALAMPVAKVGTALSLMQLKGLINSDKEKYYLS